MVAGFYRTCVIDGVLERSPAEHVRRPAVPPESPTLGFTHLSGKRGSDVADGACEPQVSAERRLRERPGLFVCRMRPRRWLQAGSASRLQDGIAAR